MRDTFTSGVLRRLRSGLARVSGDAGGASDARPTVADAAHAAAPRPVPSDPVPSNPVPSPVPPLSDLDVLVANVKNLGYHLAVQRRDDVLLHVDTSGEPRHHGVVSKATTQDDVESPWFSYWCAELLAAPLYHRKLWEFAIVLQALHEHDLLRPGVRGIGFGCGEEPLASYFAARGMDVTVTDVDAEHPAGAGWIETHQHTASLDLAFRPELVDRASFDRHVTHRFVDMNDVPEDLPRDHDFAWSICAIEHVGSIEAAWRFVERSVDLVRPGGLLLHTTEYNYLPTGSTLDEGPTVLFQRHHIEDLRDRLAARGARLLGPDFDIGTGALDRYVDMPPFFNESGLMATGAFTGYNQVAHLRMLLGSYPTTCFALLIEKD